MISEMVADQVAPSYWIPNRDTIVRNDDPNILVANFDILRLVHRANFFSVQNIRNIIVEVDAHR